MTEEERIRQYALNTKIKNYNRYSMKISEINSQYELSKRDIFHALCLTFDSGMAKGYRARRREESQHG